MEKNNTIKNTADLRSIGFGMAMGGMLSLLIIVPVFGNDIEAFCIFPIVILGMILMGWADKKVDKKNGNP